jgi:hypothetical protein
MNDVVVWLFVAGFFIILATAELVSRLLKKEPFWVVLRRWLNNIFDTLSGGL